MIENKLINLNFYTNAYGNETVKILGDSANISYSSLASCRLQQLPALEAARSLGIKPEIWSLHSEFPEHLEEMHSARLCIVGKLLAPTLKLRSSMAMANLAALTRLKSKKIPILAVYSDHHLIHREKQIRDLHQDLFNLVDGAVFPTKKLESMAKRLISRNIKSYIIEDPCQIKNYIPYNKKNTNEKFEIIWFGQSQNLKYLFEILPSIAQQKYPGNGIRLTILSNDLNKASSQFTDYIRQKSTSNLTFRLINWNIDMQPTQFEDALKLADIALIPSNPNDPHKMGVSHNRLVDSIKSGCIPIASPMDSYRELSKLCIITEDFPEAICQLIRDYKRISFKHSLHREALLARFTPESNLDKWKKTILDISSVHQS